MATPAPSSAPPSPSLSSDGGKAQTPAPQDQSLTPVEHWNAGLAAWRLGLFSDAREHFQALAKGAGGSSWLKSAGAFWSARVALRARQRTQVSYWLRAAATYPRTLYGLIAERLLGTGLDLDFAAEPFTALDARVVMGFDAGRRALALLQVDERGRAAEELRALAAGNNPALLQSLAGLADRAGLAALSLEIAGTLADCDGRSHDSAFYPVPRWTPQGGFTVDRALLIRADAPGIAVRAPRHQHGRRRGIDAAHARDGARHGRAHGAGLERGRP